MHVDLEAGEPVNFDELEIIQSHLTETNEEYFRTEVIKNNKEHIREFKEAIAELNGLMNQGTFTTRNRLEFTNEEIRTMYIVKAKLILAIKETAQPDYRKKDRLVAQAVGKRLGSMPTDDIL